jgi:hypothetical protein
VDLDISFTLTYVVGSTICCYMDLIVLTSFTWQVLFVTIPMAYVIVKLQVMHFCLILFCIFMIRIRTRYLIVYYTHTHYTPIICARPQWYLLFTMTKGYLIFYQLSYDFFLLETLLCLCERTYADEWNNKIFCS